MTDWLTYFTPAELCEALLRKVRLRRPTSIVDICAGRGNLLSAAAERWPNARLLGNDLYRDLPEHVRVAEWTRREGRGFAQDMLAEGRQADLVLANPPFGRSRALANIDADLPDEVKKLLRSPRIECGMTVASALLVGPRGMLATIVPESMVRGATYRPLREWLATFFPDIQVIPLARQKFGRRDLGVAFLIARREARRTVVARRGGQLLSEGYEPLKKPAVAAFKVSRGTLTSAVLNRFGNGKIIHYGDHASGSAYRMRRTSLASAREIPAHVRVQPGDVVVCRVGRHAGVASVYSESVPAVFTDCVLRVRGTNDGARRALRRAVRAGLLTKYAQQSVHGLGARFITQNDLATAVSRALSSEKARG